MRAPGYMSQMAKHRSSNLPLGSVRSRLSDEDMARPTVAAVIALNVMLFVAPSVS